MRLPPQNDDFFLCDNYSTCQGAILARVTKEQTIMVASARGWHVWQGITMSGHPARVQLCDRCVSKKRERAPERLDGEVPLF